jgi:hypothetical protein
MAGIVQTVSFPAILFLLLFLSLLLFFLLLALLQKLVGGHVAGDEIEMQSDEIEKQKSEDDHEGGCYPRNYYFGQSCAITVIYDGAADHDVDDNDGSEAEGRDNADHKIFVVSLPDTVIEPHAVMVEEIDAAVAGAAVFAVCQAVAVAKLTVEDFVVFWRKDDFFVVAGPFVVVDHAVSGVGEGGHRCGEHKGEEEEKGDGEEGGGEDKGGGAGVVDQEGEEDDEVGGQLGGGGTVGEAVGGVVLAAVVGRRCIIFLHLLLHFRLYISSSRSPSSTGPNSQGLGGLFLICLSSFCLSMPLVCFRNSMSSFF